jgi:transposase-like protein
LAGPSERRGKKGDKMTRQKYSAKFKFDRIIESLQRGSVAEVARQYGFRANLLSKWRKEFFEIGPKLFETRPDKKAQQMEKKIKKLEQMIGKKEVELDLLKNFSDFYGSGNGS